MPTRSEIADLLAVPALPPFRPCTANHAIASTYVSVSKPDELAMLWTLLREGFARDWAAYFTGAGGDRGLRIGPRPRDRRAIFVAARIHMTAQGMKLSSHRRLGGLNRVPVLTPDLAPTPACQDFLASLPPVLRTGPLFCAPYVHADVIAAAGHLLPRALPPT